MLISYLPIESHLLTQFTQKPRMQWHFRDAWQSPVCLLYKETPSSSPEDRMSLELIKFHGLENGSSVIFVDSCCFGGTTLGLIVSWLHYWPKNTKHQKIHQKILNWPIPKSCCYILFFLLELGISMTEQLFPLCPFTGVKLFFFLPHA